MGLTVTSLSDAPMNAERGYYLYILHGGWGSELDRILDTSLHRIISEAIRSNAAVISGIDSTHFNNDVFSWHHINGEAAEKLLPAVLITTVHPKYFKYEGDPYWRNVSMKEQMKLIPLNGVAGNSDEVIAVLKSIFEDMRAETPLKKFKVVRKMKPSILGLITDAVILKPSISGIGIDLKQAGNSIRAKRARS